MKILNEGKQTLQKSQIRTDERNPNSKLQEAVNSFLTLLTDRLIGFLNPATTIGATKPGSKDTSNNRYQERQDTKVKWSCLSNFGELSEAGKVTYSVI